MQYDQSTFSYGVELEYGNAKFGAPLPDGAKWNTLDNTCVSSTGIANDPQGKLYAYGGEINTAPTNTIEEQVAHIADINHAVKGAIVNYRSNLHIHIRVPGLRDDLEACKQLLRYVHAFQQEAFDIVETIPQPIKGSMSAERYEWELKRAKRRARSHQYKLPQSRVDAMLAAPTTKLFYEEHAALTEKGRMWYFSPRAGINLRQMWEETNTIEFRHFPGTMNLDHMESSIRWCRDFLDLALNSPDTSPRELLWGGNDYSFQDFEPYEFETEQVYQFTNHDTNTRKVVAARLDALRQVIDIDNLHTSSKDVYAEVLKLKEAGL